MGCLPVMITSRSELAAMRRKVRCARPSLRSTPTADTRMSRFWSAVVHGLTPYVPGEQPKLDNLVKLNTNEHPCGWGGTEAWTRTTHLAAHRGEFAARCYHDGQTTHFGR